MNGHSIARDSYTRAALVTGASGFIGQHVVASLVDEGWRVRVLTRSPQAVFPQLVEVVCLSGLEDYKAMREAMEGFAAVVHLAGRAHVRRETTEIALAKFREANVQCTKHVLQAAIDSRVAQFITLSSVAAVASSSSVILDESSPPRPDTPYGLSKLEAENAVRVLADSNEISAAILRPPMVYGPRMKGNPLALIKLIDKGFLLPFGYATRQRSVLYVGNLVAAILRLLELKFSRTEVFFVSDSHSISTAELIERMANAIDRSPRVLNVPIPLLRLALQAGEFVLSKTQLGSMTGSLDRLVRPLVVSSAKLLEMTCFTPPIDTTDGLRATGEWFLKVKRYQIGTENLSGKESSHQQHESPPVES